MYIVIYYHVTSASNKDSILEKGLIPQAGRNTQKAGDEEGVYLFTSYDAMKDALSGWLLDLFDEDEYVIILQVKLPDSFEIRVNPVAEWEAICYEIIPPEFIEVIEMF